ncbi:hypothetical protein VNO78_02783 [Psophocarpus tetragonolobus]|uniref:Uncharacterized protein n=1 Tax=Psophocarpus tetragonolobus TaxID=3891 RepID=A0AAN9TCP2_PSOTE
MTPSLASFDNLCERVQLPSIGAISIDFGGIEEDPPVMKTLVEPPKQGRMVLDGIGGDNLEASAPPNGK